MLDLFSDLPAEAAGVDIAHVPATPETLAYLDVLFRLVPATRDIEHLRLTLPTIAGGLSCITRLGQLLARLQRQRPLDTREAAALQLCDSLFYRKYEVETDAMRYCAHLVATGTVKQLLDVRTVLLRDNLIHLPDHFKGPDWRANWS
jgi:hypothetical protein